MTSGALVLTGVPAAVALGAGATTSPRVAERSSAATPARDATPTGTDAVSRVSATSGPSEQRVQGKARAGQRTAPRPQRFKFRLATFNILGSQHTAGPGGFGPGSMRARMTAAEIKAKNIDVIGMQEVQRDQQAVLADRLPNYTIWPGTGLGNQGIRLQIAWNKRAFKVMKTGTIITRFDRQRRPIPWVMLKHRDSGRRFYVVTVHNSPLGLEGERDAALRAEIRLINRLRATGKPVFVTGDMNEKEEFYCKVTSGTDLQSANGGRAGAPGCVLPARRLRIDWIMGGGRVRFSDYEESNGHNVRHISDHELISTRVEVLPHLRTLERRG